MGYGVPGIVVLRNHEGLATRMRFTKLDQEVIDILCCPLCKAPVYRINSPVEGFLCRTCKTTYGEVTVFHTTHNENICDFRIRRPSYCIPVGVMKWASVQAEYENSLNQQIHRDSLSRYLDEIDSVKEIYTEEFPNIEGNVLDVGGGQGILRHYLVPNSVSLYVSADPFLDTFRGLESQPNLLKAYPCLSDPCNFLACHAEYLPFTSGTFDWVHMRSVLDHFEDPYLALKEAYRVLKVGGFLLVGLSVYGGRSSLKYRQGKPSPAELFSLPARVAMVVRLKGMTGLAEAISARLRRLRAGNMDDHTFRWKYDDLVSLLHVTGLIPVKQHWQKPPFTMCIYILARKAE